MTISIKQDLKENRPTFLKSDFNKYLVDKVQITQDSKRLWFKGSRYR